MAQENPSQEILRNRKQAKFWTLLVIVFRLKSENLPWEERDELFAELCQFFDKTEFQQQLARIPGLLESAISISNTVALLTQYVTVANFNQTISDLITHDLANFLANNGQEIHWLEQFMSVSSSLADSYALNKTLVVKLLNNGLWSWDYISSLMDNGLCYLKIPNPQQSTKVHSIEYLRSSRAVNMSQSVSIEQLYPAFNGKYKIANQPPIYVLKTPVLNGDEPQSAKEAWHFWTNVSNDVLNETNATAIATVVTLGNQQQQINLQQLSGLVDAPLAELPVDKQSRYQTFKKTPVVFMARKAGTQVPYRVKFLGLSSVANQEMEKLVAICESALLQTICITISNLADQQQSAAVIHLTLLVCMVRSFVFLGLPKNDADFVARFRETLTENSDLQQWFDHDATGSKQSVTEILTLSIHCYQHMLKKLGAEHKDLRGASPAQFAELLRARKNNPTKLDELRTVIRRNLILPTISFLKISPAAGEENPTTNQLSASDVEAYVEAKYDNADKAELSQKISASEEKLDFQLINQSSLIKVGLLEQYLLFINQHPTNLTAQELVTAVMLLQAMRDLPEMSELRKAKNSTGGGAAQRAMKHDLDKLLTAILQLPSQQSMPQYNFTRIIDEVFGRRVIELQISPEDLITLSRYRGFAGTAVIDPGARAESQEAVSGVKPVAQF